jgi:hypothetical protein
LPRTNTRSPRRNGRKLRVRLKEVVPHRTDHTSSTENNVMSIREIMLTQILFLAPEAEEKAKVG